MTERVNVAMLNPTAPMSSSGRPHLPFGSRTVGYQHDGRARYRPEETAALQALFEKFFDEMNAERPYTPGADVQTIRPRMGEAS
jgi:hypothetical protein